MLENQANVLAESIGTTDAVEIPQAPLLVRSVGVGLLVGGAVAVLVVAATYVAQSMNIAELGVQGSANVHGPVGEFLGQPRYIEK